MKEVRTLVMGPVLTNTYILSENGHCLIVDPAANLKRIQEAVQNLQVDAICLTHGHFDHIQAVDALRKIYQCDVYISEYDEELLRDSHKNASDMLKPFTIAAPVKYYTDQTQINSWNLEVIEAPGHTKGSVLLICDDLMFCGDVLFKEGIGRTDLYGGSHSQMKRSLDKINSLRKDYKVYCGHGESTTLFDEFENNPYLKEQY